MALRDKTNEELFKLYKDDLVLRLRNPKNLSDTLTMLGHFREYLGEYPPSRELAKGFLARYSDRKPRTLYRYAQMIKAFMKWYSEPIDDIKVRVPKSLPAYTEDSDIEKLLEVIPNKRSHKGCIDRDKLLVLMDWRSGLRRAELANLLVRDVHGDAVIVRSGKNKKDRMVPLPESVSGKVKEFIKCKRPDDRVFGLGGPAIGMKIKHFAKKAGLTDFHTHVLRHKYATDLLEAGVNIKVVQALLGHENLNTTQAYLSITDQSLYDAVKKLDDDKISRDNGHEKPRPEVQKGGRISTSSGSLDSHTEALLMAIDPTNLCQALGTDKVEEVDLAKLPVINKAVADRLRELLENEARRGRL